MWFSQHGACPCTASWSSWKQTLRASTPTSHHSPPLVFGKLVCKWGPGTADKSWRGNFGDMMLGETRMQRGKDPWWLGAVWAVLQGSLQRHPEKYKPSAPVSLALEPSSPGFFLPEACGCRQYLLSSHSHGIHHPTKRAWSQPGMPLGLSCLWIFSCCAGVTETAGKTKTLQQHFLC